MNICIPKLGLAYNHLTPCRPYVINCQTKDQKDFENFHCSAEGMVFYTAGCEELKRARAIKNTSGGKKRLDGNTINHVNRGHVENIFALVTYNFLADEIEDLQEKTDILRYLTACKQSHMTYQVLKKLGRLFPSETASLALSFKTVALYKGDVMREILGSKYRNED